MSRATAAFVAAILVALVAAHLLRDTPGYAIRQADGSLAGDIDHYVYWTRLVTQGGVQAAYGGTWPETYAVYPPITLYAYQAIGTVYQLLEDPSFDPERAARSELLHRGIKFVALGWHLLTGLAIFGIVRLGQRKELAGWAGAAYVANPAALYDVAHWAQPDAAHSLFSVLAIGLLGVGSSALAWGAFALAALAKPQAWVLLPLMGLATWRQAGPRALLNGALIGGAVGLVVIAPFLITGRLDELLSLPGTISSVMPVVSADAHNAWWLFFSAHGMHAILTPDSTRLVGLLSYRTVAGVLVVGQLALTYWLIWTRRASLPEAAALGVVGWFVFTTQAHENHVFFALPLLSLAWPGRRSLLLVYALVSLSLLLNMLLHDQLVLEALGLSLDHSGVDQLRTLNAALMLGCWLGWTIAALRRAPCEPNVSRNLLNRGGKTATMAAPER